VRTLGGLAPVASATQIRRRARTRFGFLAAADALGRWRGGIRDLVACGGPCRRDSGHPRAGEITESGGGGIDHGDAAVLPVFASASGADGQLALGGKREHVGIHHGGDAERLRTAAGRGQAEELQAVGGEGCGEIGIFAENDSIAGPDHRK
jgi:hypothetical protein